MHGSGVDALIGSHSEPLPKGFGFSDTAFRISISMASRRSKSDRFIAGQWNEETYSKEGLQWVQNNGMKDVLGRHFPELKGVPAKGKNVFAPWDVMEGTKGMMESRRMLRQQRLSMGEEVFGKLWISVWKAGRMHCHVSRSTDSRYYSELPVYLNVI